MTWDKTVVDRRADLVNWVELFRQLLARNLKVFLRQQPLRRKRPGNREAVLGAV